MKPIQYQKGYVEFYKLRFKVTPDTLIPRPETELLVDEVLSMLRSNLNQGATLTPVVLDIGTGAGNIGISIAKNVPNAQIIATDISESALKIARKNAKLHGVEDKITFIQSNLLNVIPSVTRNLPPQTNKLARKIATSLIALPHSGTIARNDNKIDVIVTNLPYIPSARIPYLDSSVKDFEPLIALDGGEDGFELYRKLFKQIKQKGLKPKLIIGEIDYTHGELAALEAQKYFPNAQIEVKKDLAHKQRILLVAPF